MSCTNMSMNLCMHYARLPSFIPKIFTRVHIFEMPCQDITEAPRVPVPPRTSRSGEWIQRLIPAVTDEQLVLPMEVGSMDDEFNNLANDIHVCTERFMQLQETMTTALDRYQWCRLVGMDAHMLGRLVHASIDIGLTIPQVEFLQERVPDLHLMENEMWEATQEIEPHLDDLLHPDSTSMVAHADDNTKENLPITHMLEACRVDSPSHEESGPVEPPMGERTLKDEFIHSEACRMCQAPDEEYGLEDPELGERTVDVEFNFIADEVKVLTGYFMRLQKTMTNALERYRWCLLLSQRIYDFEMVVLDCEHIGFDSQQKAYIESKIPDLVEMEKIAWEQSLEIKPHLENLYHPDFEMMDNQLNNVE